MDDELGEGRVEVAVAEGQPLRRRALDVDLGIALACRLDEGLRRIDGADGGGAEQPHELRRERSGAAADVEHALTGVDAGEAREPRREAARVAPHEAVVRLGGNGEAHRFNLLPSSFHEVTMDDTPEIEIRRLGADEVRARLDELAAVLADCVAGGASVSYMAPFTHEQAREAFAAWADEVERDARLLLAAFLDGTIVGTVQVVYATPPNQPHRADVAKLLVHRPARRRGVAQLLMEHAEREARAEGKTLLVLDTVTGDDAERLYMRLGWTRVGVIPNYALYPDGRPCDTTVFWKAV